ncbi:hypothetical protein BD626DRAFT_475397 [Schizophyllum amplum]|uniref:Uncharacterized protein n=1 Tax=Schizophyllum amplum TaxID=97359 RepID=A0A550CYF9_9AGAR|nr:hypothetical protein BD626DRAFT_475397 [Auriculariopsis ampla]
MAPDTPRPILKDPSAAPPEAARGVHFPPTPSLSRIFSTHPPSEYDRTPIVVSANTCALPERGGRTYTDDDAPPTPTPASKRYSEAGDMHPSALTASYPSHLPSLIPDMTTSESEESDGLCSPPEFQHAVEARAPLSLDLAAALAFLPHPTQPKSTEAPAESQAIPARPTRHRRSRKVSASSRPSLHIDITGIDYDEDDDEDVETVVSYSPTLCCTMPNRNKLARLKNKLGNTSFDMTPSEECLGGF